MADISKIKVDDIEYNVKDAVARDSINNLDMLPNKIVTAIYSEVSSLDELHTQLNSALLDCPIYSVKFIVINTDTVFDPFDGGSLLFQLFKHNENFCTAEATVYTSNGIKKYGGCKYYGEWGNWTEWQLN